MKKVILSLKNGNLYVQEIPKGISVFLYNYDSNLPEIKKWEGEIKDYKELFFFACHRLSQLEKCPEEKPCKQEDLTIEKRKDTIEKAVACIECWQEYFKKELSEENLIIELLRKYVKEHKQGGESDLGENKQS